jgi:hypothetical protein
MRRRSSPRAARVSGMLHSAVGSAAGDGWTNSAPKVARKSEDVMRRKAIKDIGDLPGIGKPTYGQLERALNEARGLLTQVLVGEDILTDRKWKRAAMRLTGET